MHHPNNDGSAGGVVFIERSASGPDCVTESVPDSVSGSPLHHAGAETQGTVPTAGDQCFSFTWGKPQVMWGWVGRSSTELVVVNVSCRLPVPLRRKGAGI